MKYLIYILLFFMVSLVGMVIYISGKSHIDAVHTVSALDSANVQLKHEVVSIHQTYAVELSKKDSTLASKDSTIKVQKYSITNLVAKAREAFKFVSFARAEPVYIHDTVIIEKTKNFWGHTKSVEVMASAPPPMEAPHVMADSVTLILSDSTYILTDTTKHL